MKKHLLIAALAAALAGPATAGVIATSNNKSGGQIKLTDDICPGREGERPAWLFAYATTQNGAFMSGCWKLVDTEILVVYEDGDKRLYQADGFTMRDKPSKPKTTKPSYRNHL